ncbi:MAG: hAT transposon family protein [Planctomycetes bacterium]|nr:hAT transposon family protein [Planctomycetota bacterium]
MQEANLFSGATFYVSLLHLYRTEPERGQRTHPSVLQYLDEVKGEARRRMSHVDAAQMMRQSVLAIYLTPQLCGHLNDLGGERNMYVVAHQWLRDVADRLQLLGDDSSRSSDDYRDSEPPNKRARIGEDSGQRSMPAVLRWQIYHESAEEPQRAHPLSAEMEEYDRLSKAHVMTEDPADFWRARKETLPLMYQLAMHCLSHACSSADAERAFSLCGNTMTKKRARLSDQSLTNLVIIGSNRAIVDKIILQKLPPKSDYKLTRKLLTCHDVGDVDNNSMAAETAEAARMLEVYQDAGAYEDIDMTDSGLLSGDEL